MKKIFISLCMVLLLAMSLGAAPRSGSTGGKGAMSMTTTVDNEQYINANNILMFVTNHGNFARDLAGVFGYDYGTFYPYNTVEDIQSGALDNSIVYASGLWMGAVDSASGETRVIIAEYEDEYVPGPMSGGYFLPDNPAFKVYKLYKDSLANNPNDDYTNWPIDQGAPWKIVDGDTVPDMIGDQMLWAVFNDADTAQHGNDAGKTKPLGIEVRQTTFAYDRTDPLGNVIFLRIQVFNKGVNVLKECYFSLWADPDLGQFTDDYVGCDTNLSVGFCYNGDNSDNQFGSAPPCVGYDFFQGPLEYTGDPADTGRMWGQLWPEYRNMGMATFNKYINGTDPDDYQQTYNYMRGLRRDGSNYTYQGQVTRYFVSGDPVTGTGDLDAAAADRRFMLSTGPVDFRPGDSTEILAAIVVGQGADRLSSVAVMKYNDLFAQDAYENGFVLINPPAPPVVTVATNDNRITLTWTDTSEVDHGTYPFEGYTVWQGESVTGDVNGKWTRLATFDIQNNVVNIYDQVVDPLTGAVEYRLTKKGSDAGVWHSIVLKDDAILGGRLRNLTEYYYKVEAYSYNPDVEVAKTPTSEAIVKATPQSPIAGTAYEYNFADTVNVTHIGGSDGMVVPFVYNSKLFDGYTYQVSFSDTLGIHIDTLIVDNPPDPPETTFVSYDLAWHLVNLSTGDTLHQWEWDQSGSTIFNDIPGIQYTVSGPPLLQGVEYTYESSEPENLSPVAVAEWTDDDGKPYEGGRWFTGDEEAGGELLNGGVYLAPNFDLTTLAPADYKTVDIHWYPMLSYTDITGDDLYTVGEDYVASDGQGAFMYQGWDGSTYEGFYNVPFTAWDVSDPDNPRQLNVVVRDRDANLQWDMTYVAEDDDTLTLPNGGDIRYNYIWILNTDYDATGTAYDPSTGIDFMAQESDAMWVLWFGDRGNGGMLAEEGILNLVPAAVNSIADTFTFVLNDTIFTGTSEEQLKDINVVPNPFYLYGPYDPTPGNYTLKFQHLPAECTITIYNLAGDFIRQIEKTDAFTSTASWDVKTENGLVVASGIYIYVVDAKGFGTKIGKMAVFTENEVLKTY